VLVGRQHVWPVAHAGPPAQEQPFAVQLSSVTHLWPQEPQLAVSIVGSVQRLPQQMSPDGQSAPVVPHWQVELIHCSPLAHAWPHEPQLEMSLVVSAQPVVQHALSVPPHAWPPQPQTLLEQVNGEWHGLPHWPQSVLLIDSSAQPSVQQTWPKAHGAPWHAQVALHTPRQQTSPAVVHAPPLPHLHCP
jgi:hypothetical protein